MSTAPLLLLIHLNLIQAPNNGVLAAGHDIPATSPAPAQQLFGR